MKARVISLVLLIALAITALAACADTDKVTGDRENGEGFLYDPYYNRFKPDAPGGNAISMSGKKLYFKDMQIRDKNEIKLVEDERSLKILYTGVYVEFISEDTVKIVDYSKFFNIPETKGVREGNVLTIQASNKAGNYTFDIRIEIHGETVYLIHNAHHYTAPGTYATIEFTTEEE